MDLGRAHQVGAIALVELIHVGDVLEVVGVQGAVLHGQVGLDIVVELHDLQGNALLRQQVFHHFQNLGVGGGGGAHLQHGAI